MREADWLSVADASARIQGAVAPLTAHRLPLREALGTVLAQELVAPLDLPPWDNSAMDGFAVRATDIRGATEAAPRELRVVDDVPAGATARVAVEAGTAVRIMTGAPVPAGADSVVRVEHTDGGSAIGTAAGRVAIRSDADARSNIRPRGEDVRRGQVVLGPGAVLGPGEVAVAAGLGYADVVVVRRPRVAVLASGDELVELDGFAEVLAGRRIVSTNSYSLAGQLQEAGMEPVLLGIARDTPQSLREHLLRADGCDAVITSAGISMGAHDHVRSVLHDLGVEPEFWRVRMRPGSPFAFGTVGALGGIPWFGLPGNPVSSMVTFELFVRPALLRMAGHQRVFPPLLPARMADPYRGRAGLAHFPRVRLRWEGPELVASLTGAQGSGILSSMAGADGLAVVAADRGSADSGDVLPTLVLRGAPLREALGLQ